MVKQGTRKAHQKKGSPGSKMGLKKLRSAFDHMEKVVNRLKPKAKQSFQDALSEYRVEWHKVFKREISPAEAASYLKFRYGLKGTAVMTRRSKKMHGGAAPLGGAPIDYSMRSGLNGVYGNFPSYQQEGLDRYYSNSLSADCGKTNGFPTEGSKASQVGGGWFDGLVRPINVVSPIPNNTVNTAVMVDYKGQKPFPSPDPVGNPPLRTPNTNYIASINPPWSRSFTGTAAGGANGVRTGEIYGRV